MGFFSRNSKKKQDTAEPVWQENPLFEQEGPQRISTVDVPMRDLYDELSASKKGGTGLFKKNSDKYNEVSDSMVRVLSVLASPLKKNDYESTKEVARQVTDSYQNLIAKCNRYLKRYAFSGRGKARQDIVEKIKAQAMEDQLTLSTYWGQYQTLPASEQASNVWQAVEFARRKKFYMKEADAKHDHAGGAASHLTILKQGDLKNTDTSGFFKEAEIFTYREDKEVHFFEIMEQAKKQSPISDDLYARAKKKAQHYADSNPDNFNLDSLAESLTKMDELLTEPELFEFVNTVKLLASASTTTSAHINRKGLLNLGLKHGESINLTNRNVATSRTAELLGVGDIIARSETVEMIEPGQTSGRIGNLMQKAEGKAAASVYEHYRDQKAFSPNSESISKKISGNLQRQLVNLQVLDYITGQVDRHMDNYFIQEDKDTGMLTGVTGIDNDFSFGDYSQSEGIIGQNGRSIFYDDGTFLIPHMDAAIADKILTVQKDQLFFLLGDLLEPSAIELAWGRLSKVKTAIQKKKEEKDSHFFLQEQEWNADTLEDFRNKLHTFGPDRALTYVTRFLESESSRVQDAYQPIVKRQNQYVAFWNQLVAQKQFDSPDKIKTYMEGIIDKKQRKFLYAEFQNLYRKGLFKPNMLYNELPLSNDLFTRLNCHIDTELKKAK